MTGHGIRRLFVSQIIGMAVILIVLVAVSVWKLSGKGDDTATTGVAVEASTATPQGDTQAGQRPPCPVGRIAGVELDCLGSQVIPRPTDEGKATVVFVWAWWCKPCRIELPAAEQFAAVHPELIVTGVHEDADDKAGLHMLNELGVSLPSLSDTEGALAAGADLPKVVPIVLVVAPDGTVAGQIAKPFETVGDIEQAVLPLVEKATQHKH